MMLVSLQIILYYCVLSEIGVMDCDRISQVMQPVFLDVESEPVQKATCLSTTPCSTSYPI